MELNRGLSRPGLAYPEIVLRIIHNHELLWPIFRVWHPTMFVKRTKMGRYPLLLFETDIEVFLFAEHDTTPLSSEEGELIKTFFGKFCLMHP